jgi:hypothetical protein
MTKTTHRVALERADRIIEWMMSYIGRMAPPDNGIFDLNEHGLYMERLRRQERKQAMRKPQKSTGDARPLDQKPAAYLPPSRRA